MYPVKVIPDKLFFKIGEVCELIEVQPHVLRYWESEFPQLTPQKNRAGQRTYRRKDVEIVMRIKQLLYDEGFTIAGAKKKLASELRGSAKLKVVPVEKAAPEALTPLEIINETRPQLREAPPPSALSSAISSTMAETLGPMEAGETAPEMAAGKLNAEQRRALRGLKDELQALLTMLKRDDIMTEK